MENATIKDLKAQAYDKIAEIEQYNAAIERVKNELSGINQAIQKKYLEEEAAKKSEEADTVKEEIGKETIVNS